MTQSRKSNCTALENAGLVRLELVSERHERFGEHFYLLEPEEALEIAGQLQEAAQRVMEA